MPAAKAFEASVTEELAGTCRRLTLETCANSESGSVEATESASVSPRESDLPPLMESRAS